MMTANAMHQNRFYEEGRKNMLYSYATAIVLTVLLPLLLFGCGGGSSSSANGNAGFTVTGKISLANGTPIKGATVNLYKTSYTIYSTASVNGHLYGTVNSNGVESVSLVPMPPPTTTDVNGVYSFTGLPGGNYTIQPSSTTYVFKWSSVPTLGTIGVITITDSGMTYVYNPEGTGNMLFADGANGSIIYNNTVSPFALTNSGQYFNFEASLPGGTGN